MSRLAKQAYLRTRLAIMSANLLGREKLNALARLPLEELFKASGFDATKGINKGARLAAFERALMQTWLNELSALLRPLDGPARHLLTQWASRYELLNIKALVRGKMGQLPNEEIERSLFELPGFLSLNHSAPFWLHVCGILLTAGRLSHGLNFTLQLRQVLLRSGGMVLTSLSLALGAVLCLPL